jgi:hypothetical protein
MGNNDEIFQLSDGSIWQVKYEYEYLYAYYPSVVVCPSTGKLIIGSKQLNIAALSSLPPTPQATNPAPKSTGAITQTRIDGDFNGWEGETIYKLQNGQIWQQSSYHYHYHYAYAPEVLIYPSSGGYKMHVDGDSDEDVYVQRLR